MRSFTVRAAVVAAAAAAVVGGGLLPAMASASASADAGRHSATTARPLQSCAADRRQGYAHCMSRFVNPGTGGRAPAGYLRKDLAKAYNIPKAGSTGTVAVIIAFDVPNAEKDLAVYRKVNGLPPCTTANGCFTKVNQRGQKGNYPAADGGWALEGSMDLDMVSAGCPTCKILLVEADDNHDNNLAAATRTARKLGATVTSHSYGGTEYGGMWANQDAYEAPGAIAVASSGDWGFTAPQAPSVFRTVLAVGGTTLNRASNARGFDEDVWFGAGSGCSAYVPKSWVQKDKHCAMRTVADVSAVADPDTGVAIYDTYENPFGIPPGWIIGGGTSASAPLVAGMIGNAGNGATYSNSVPYRKPGAFYDVVGGSNGSCGEDYLCTGVKGYDAPTGVGSPRGLAGL
ncbi:S53 family peptidase [Nostocoides jenkinsii]|jgi:subtilase family serine protease|uniref:Peptidase S8 and S53 subtilisin kexin sedolisin n=1 Tax=Nostocoides jenkinsii Ben 74 TaxID=1193518 RepID=A0A077M6C3_9MICO|nr:S8 family serine peptidase [Tetrasphaera jenkinsii]CCI52144.1 Peptidase S8 and S53 subtilisin kexin sedolisin [Tetrasphaera jenkinsii Ben 74]